jgi:hypothetical protein
MKRGKPYLQGALDSLCAVYGVVNAAKIINDLTEEDSRDLFNKILLYLEEKDILGNALINGINIGLVVIVS